MRAAVLGQRLGDGGQFTLSQSRLRPLAHTVARTDENSPENRDDGDHDQNLDQGEARGDRSRAGAAHDPVIPTKPVILSMKQAAKTNGLLHPIWLRCTESLGRLAG